MNVLESFSLKDKVALVTGAGSPIGYGAQCAEALYEAGATVFIASRNQEKLAAYAARYPGMRYLPLDLEDEDSVKAIVPKIVQEAGHLDILVNNAVARTALAKWDLPMTDFDRSLRANASALFALTRVASRQMVLQGNGGSIINIDSYMGILGLNKSNYEGTGMQTDSDEWPSPAYHYEKGGMLNFTRWAASILGPYHVRVNCVNPGGYCPPDNPQPEAFLKQYSARTQLGRMANDTDMKGIIVLLASDASEYITGACIPVAGGYTAK